MSSGSDTQRKTKWARLIGVFIFAAAMYLALFAFNHDHEEAFGLALIVFPLAVGVFTPLILDPRREMSGGQCFGATTLVYFVLAVILMAVGHETAFCLIIGSPLFLFVTAFGMALTRGVLGPQAGDHQVKAYTVAAILPFALAPVELPHNFGASQHHVVNSITIAAAPQQVWDQIIDFTPVQDDERIWAFSHNILGGPLPIRSEMVGNVRHAYWTMSVTYEEHLTAIEPAQHMAWDIVFSDDFNMDGYDDHIHPNSVQFRLQSGRYDLDYDGTYTTLTLRTDYQLRTLWNGYIALWGQQFLGDNHRAILHVIQQRAEAA